MKNKMAKIAFIILSIVFVFSACMTVFAVTTKSVTESQNGIEATLNFNKQEYNANENVEVTLNVKNNNSYAVKNIQTELIVPSKIKLATGSLKQETFSLNAGESKVQEVALEKVVETSNEPTTNSPQTGDNVVVYISMMTISAVALVFIAVKKKWIHKKKVMSLVLCFILIGTMTLTSVVNANVAVKEFTVEGTIKYDGEDVVIKGKVTYDYEVYSKVQIDGVDKGMYADGNTVNITAEDAPEGKHFAGWTVVKGNVTLADANSSTTTFVMGKEDVEIKSNYEVNTYTIDVTLGENGKVTPEGNISVKHGDSKTFTITPNTGYHIEKVEVDGQDKGTNDTYTFTDVKDNHTIKATFAINTYTITSSANEGGTITETATVNYGGSKTFTITPNTGYHIVAVKVDGGSIGTIESYTFENVTKNHTIEVEFSNVFYVSDESSWQTAAATGGIINLASNILMSNSIYVQSKATINGGIYSINNHIGGNVYSALKFGNGSEVEINNGHFENIYFEEGSRTIINGGDYDVARFLGADSVEINEGSFEQLYYWSANFKGETTGKLIINGGTIKKFYVDIGRNYTINGGTFYRNISAAVDTSTHSVTKTTDADGVDIWVVTEI